MSVFFFRSVASRDRLAELNPYVSVDTLSTKLDENTDLSYLKQYQVSTCLIFNIS